MTAYPVRANGLERADKRFVGLARDVALLMEQHAYERLTGVQRTELEHVLFEFIYGSRGAAGELERRLNGTAAPLVDDEGKLDSYDCCAAAHELRRNKGADGAIVIAVDAQNHVHVGCAVEPQSQADFLASKLMATLDDLAHGAIQDVVLDLVVPEQGGLKS